ncbi:hypothetical protein E4K72_03550 [Oxalobacteraceae bacterium OM1]|nr:hypothetical protein E4K72_03550 [Oxalobacteraceae bacterium OM1]
MQQLALARRNQRQRGFSLVAAFILVAILMTVVAYFLAGQGVNTTSAGSVTNTARGSAVITQGAYLKAGFDLMTLGGNTDVSTITFNTAAATGLFNGVTGGVQPQLPDPSAFATRTAPNGTWLYKRAALTLTGVGTGGRHYAVVLTGLSRGACEQINQVLRGTTAILGSGQPVATWTGGAAATNDWTDTTNVAVTGGAVSLDKACVSTSDATPSYVYYHVVYQV